MTTSCTPKELFWNDVAALAGSTFGSLSPFFAMSLGMKDYLVAAVILLNALAIVALGLWLRRPLWRRRWAFFWICLYLGGLIATLILLKWNDWLAAGMLAMHWEKSWGRVPSAAGCLALFWIIAFFLLHQIPRHDHSQSR